MGLSAYIRLLEVPHVRRLVLGSFLGRLTAMLILAEILLAREATGSYAAAGTVAAASTIGHGVSGPFRGRQVDQRRPRRVFLTLGLVAPALLVALIVAAESGAGTAVLALLAGVAGLFGPPLNAGMRTMWTRLLDSPGDLQIAYSFDAVLTEVAFTVGPLLTGAIVALWSPEAAVAVGAGLLMAGAVLFASSPALDLPAPPREDHGLLGALASPGMRALVATWAPIGAGITVLEVASPAFAEEHGSRATAGVMLAALAAGSGIGGLWYGTRSAPADPVSRFVLLTGVLAACVALPVLAGSNLAYTALMFAAGLAFSPTIITSSHVLDRVAARGTATEAFAWILTAYMAGAAVGAQVAGLLAEGPGVRAALLSAPVFVALGALAAVAVRPRLASAAAPAP